MRTPFLIATVSIVLMAQSLSANMKIADAHVPDAAVVGESQLQVLFWKVFDATLIAPDGKFQRGKPFALTLNYQRAIPANKIVAASIKEMSAQQAADPETLARWADELTRIIPDVECGNAITGISDAQGHALFYLDGTAIGRVDDPAFSEAFFDIWLGAKSSKPELRQQLIGNTTL